MASLIIRDVMTASLRRRDEEKMKKNVESLVDEMKKVAEEKKVEGEKEEAVTEKQQNEDDLKKKEEADVKLKRSVEESDVGEAVAEEQQKREADQTQTAEKAEVPMTEMSENEKVLKDHAEKLAQKCNILEKENEILKEKCSAMTEECLQKENSFQEMKKEYDSIKLAYHITEESYEDVKSQMEFGHSRLKHCSEISNTLKRQYEIKQQVVNSYIEDVAKLKRKIADLEQDNNKLHSYHASSYVLERIFNIKPDDNDFEQNKKGIGSEYHLVPPPFEEKFTFYDDEKVEKSFNMVNQFPDNIDKIDSTKMVEIKDEKLFVPNDENFPKLNEAYCVEMPKVLPKTTECQLEEYWSSLA
ncbi:centlein-like [Helianthus annuus]|uniref:centlein-like n=1 Tax=Helianthus annuus TaxID=4232 RepID=UPI001653010C|nr:centlein-like [Helianthus annuus]